MSASAQSGTLTGAPVVDPEVQARLDMVPALRRRQRVEELSGGITNRNFKVFTAEGTFVARVSSPDGAMLAIDREVEYRNSMAAAQSGAGASVVAYAPKAGVLVVEFLPGRTFTDDDVRTPANLPRIAAACRMLHAGPRFVNDFNMFRIQQAYLALVTERGFRLPDGYRSYADKVAAIERAMQVHPEPTVPCNNDLLAGNMIDDGGRLRLIDYEYAGNNDACFELGNIWSEAALPLPLLDELVGSYYGRHSPRLVARARLWGLMSKYGWMLWASIQDATSAIDFDFWTWGMEKYDRAVPEFDGPDFARLLEEVATPDD